MTALAANRTDAKLKYVEARGHPVKGSTHIYKHALVCKVGGYLAPALNTAGYSNVLGIAESEVNNTSTTDGAADLRVLSGLSINVAMTGVAQAGVQNQVVYVADDQTVTTVVNSGVQAGKLEGYVSSGVARLFIPVGGA